MEVIRAGNLGGERYSASGASIDRWSPRRRPAGRAAGSQTWRQLLFLHWQVDVQQLRKLVPAALELDLFDNRALVGLVPFTMANVRSRSWPWRLTADFGETNVRTYVTHRGEPGVYFFSLDAASLLAVVGARTGWGLPYFWSRIECSEELSEVHYRVDRRTGPGSLDVRYRFSESPVSSMDPGEAALADFLLERYLLFVPIRGELYRGQVHHRHYPVGSAELLSLQQDLLQVAGIAPCRQAPDHVHWSSGVDVEIFGLRRVDLARGPSSP